MTTTTLPLLFVWVYVPPRVGLVRTTELPELSVVVTMERTEVSMTLPPGPTATLEMGEAVVITEPAALVVVTRIAPAMDEVVTAWPCSFVVVIATTTLVGAVFSNACVVSTMVLPSLAVDESSTGTRTPVMVVDSAATELED